MPVKSSPRYRVAKDFEFVPHAGAVIVFTKGEERSGLTAACVEKGTSIGALEEIKEKDSTDGR